MPTCGIYLSASGVNPCKKRGEPEIQYARNSGTPPLHAAGAQEKDTSMKRTLYLFGAALSLSFMIVSCAGAQESLGAVARQQRESKKPSSAKVYTNDDIAPATLPAAAPATTEAAEKSEKAEPAAEPKADDKTKRAADFKVRVDEQKKVITQLERELDVAQREYRLKVAVYYSDVGNNLRDSKKWAEQDRQQRAEIEGKQKAINEAKQKLADMQEQARKAGTRVE
jgi:hypothetical protein